MNTLPPTQLVWIIKVPLYCEISIKVNTYSYAPWWVIEFKENSRNCNDPRKTSDKGHAIYRLDSVGFYSAMCQQHCLYLSTNY